MGRIDWVNGPHVAPEPQFSPPSALVGVALLLVLTVKALVLGLHDVGVKAAIGHELSVAALLLHRAIAEDNDVVGLLHDAHVPGYEQDGAVDLLEQRLVHLWETRRQDGKG